MSGSYSAGLVLASYCVAVLASYVAIYFGTRVFEFEGTRRRNWLLGGALCLGTGIWSMHFVGMSAYQMPMDMTMSFSVGWTLVSWLPALFASALALHVITLPQVSWVGISLAALSMGAGIFGMHYLGMYAMQMQPGIQYDLVWVTISGLIAVFASGAALLICRKVRDVPIQHVLWVKAVAALVMGAAICGMHYSGMAGASYPAGAMSAPGNQLTGGWMGIPTAVVISVLLLLSIYVVYSDVRAAETARRQEELARESARQTAFYDPQTRLGNRSLLERQLLERLAVQEEGESARPFMLFYIEIPDKEALISQMSVWARLVEKAFPRAESTVRYGRNGFMVLHVPLSPVDQASCRRALNVAFKSAGMPEPWGWGASQYPVSASNSRGLIRGAQRVRRWSEGASVSTIRPADVREAVGWTEGLSPSVHPLGLLA